MTRLKELRVFDTIEHIPPERASWPPISQLIFPLWDLSVGVNTRPGIIHIQDTLRVALDMLTLHDKELQGSVSGSLIHGLLAWYASEFGLLDEDSLKQTRLQPEAKIFISDRFDVAKAIIDKWNDAGQVIGIFHGACDYPHLGHALDLADLHRFTHRSIAVINPNWLVKQEKEIPGDPRPRVDSIVWKMMQLALPTVDMVIEAPIDKGDDVASFWDNLYKTLHITRLVAGRNHRYISSYRRSMDRVGGAVIESRSAPSLFLMPSASTQQRILSLTDYRGRIYGLRQSPIWKRVAEEAEVYEKRVLRYWESHM